MKAYLSRIAEGAILKKLGVTLEDIACAWEDIASYGKEPPSWRIADRLISIGAATIVTPSFASHSGQSDINVVFWKWGRRKLHKMRVVDDYSRCLKMIDHGVDTVWHDASCKLA